MKNKSGTTLYKYTLKSLLVPGIVLGLICLAATFVNLFQVDTSMPVYSMQYFSRYHLSRFYNGRPIAGAIAPALIAFMYIGPAVFTFLSFKFQNSRTSADFYDSLPYTKTQGYISRLLAVLTWEIAIIILSMAISVLMLTVNSIDYDMSFIPKLTFSFISGSVFITGVTALAMSFTGTAFSNIAAALLIAFMPRTLMYITDRIIMTASYSNFIPLSSLGIFLNPVNNIPFAVILDMTRIWEYYGTSETLIQTGAAAYTLVMALIYLTAGFFISKYRKSELSGYGVQTAAARHILSALAALPFLAYAFSSAIRKGVFDITNHTNIQEMTVYLSIGFVAFLGMQFAHKRRPKIIVKSLPVFAIATIIAFAAVFSARGYALKLHRTVPDMEDIEYIKLDENYALEYRYKPLYNYRNLLTREIEYSETELVDIFQSSLSDMVSAYDSYRAGEIENLSMRNNLQCEFKLKNGKSITRMVNVPESDSRRIWELVSCNCDYKKLSWKLPEPGDTDSVETYMGYQLSPETSMQIYTIYKQEFESLPAETRNKILGFGNYSLNSRLNINNTGYSEIIQLANITVKGEENNHAYRTGLSISQYLPETSKYCIARGNNPNKDIFFDDIEYIKSEESKENNINLNIEIINLMEHTDYHANNIWFAYNNMAEENFYFSEEDIFSILDLLDENSFKDVSFDGIIMRIDVRISYETSCTNYTLYAQITPEQAMKMEQIYEDRIMTN